MGFDAVLEDLNFLALSDATNICKAKTLHCKGHNNEAASI